MFKDNITEMNLDLPRPLTTYTQMEIARMVLDRKKFVNNGNDVSITLNGTVLDTVNCEDEADFIEKYQEFFKQNEISNFKMFKNQEENGNIFYTVQVDNIPGEISTKDCTNIGDIKIKNEKILNSIPQEMAYTILTDLSQELANLSVDPIRESQKVGNEKSVQHQEQQNVEKENSSNSNSNVSQEGFVPINNSDNQLETLLKRKKEIERNLEIHRQQKNGMLDTKFNPTRSFSERKAEILNLIEKLKIQEEKNNNDLLNILSVAHDLEAQIETLERELQDMSSENYNVTMEPEYIEKNNKLYSIKSELEKKYSDPVYIYINNNIENYKNQISSLEQELQQMAYENPDAVITPEYIEKNNQLQSLKIEYEKFIENLSYSSMKSNLNELNEQITTLEQELQDMSAEDYNAMSTPEYIEKNNKLYELNEELKKFEQNSEYNTNNHNTELSAKIENLQREYDKLIKEEQDRIRAIEPFEKQKQEELEKINQEIQNLEQVQNQNNNPSAKNQNNSSQTSPEIDPTAKDKNLPGSSSPSAMLPKKTLEDDYYQRLENAANEGPIFHENDIDLTVQENKPHIIKSIKKASSNLMNKIRDSVFIKKVAEGLKWMKNHKLATAIGVSSLLVGLAGVSYETPVNAEKQDQIPTTVMQNVNDDQTIVNDNSTALPEDIAINDGVAEVSEKTEDEKFEESLQNTLNDILSGTTKVYISAEHATNDVDAKNPLISSWENATPAAYYNMDNGDAKEITKEQAKDYLQDGETVAVKWENNGIGLGWTALESPEDNSEKSR